MRFTVFFAVAVFCALVPVGVIANMVIKPHVSTEAFYDDNPRMRVRFEEEVFASINEARAESSYSGPTFVVEVTPRVRVSRYTNETDLNTEDYFVNVDASKIFERYQVLGEFNYERESSLTTEETDSEIFNVIVPRTTFSLNPTVQYSLTERLTATTFGNALDVSFEPDPRSTFIDYNQFGVGASLSYLVSERTAFFVNFNSSVFKTPQTSSQTDSYSYQFGFEHEFDESLRASFRIGHNISHIEFRSAQIVLIPDVPPRLGTEFVSETERSSGEIIDLEIEKDFERAEMRFGWNRRFSPSSQGSRQQTQEVSGYARYRITQQLNAEFQGSFIQRAQEGQVNLRRLQDNEVLKYTGRLIYHVSPYLRAEAGIRYRQRSRIHLGTESDSKRIFLTFRFRPRQVRYPN